MAQFTREAIKTSLIRLLSARPLEKITVKDIVDDCNITRGTFYYHYQDIYAVIEDIINAETDKIVATCGDGENWEENLLRAFSFTDRHRTAVRNIYESNHRELVERYFRTAADTLIRAYIDAKASSMEVSETDKRIITDLYRWSLKGALLEWVASGMKYPFADTLHLIAQLFEGGASRALENSRSK